MSFISLEQTHLRQVPTQSKAETMPIVLGPNHIPGRKLLSIHVNSVPQAKVIVTLKSRFEYCCPFPGCLSGM